MNVMDAYRMFLERQEREFSELSVHLRGQAARDYARGNLASVPKSQFVSWIPVRFLSSPLFLGLQFVSWTDNTSPCISSWPVSRVAGWWLGCRRGKGSVVSVEVREPLRAYRATAPRPRSADGARRDLQGLPTLDSDDPPGPLQARLLLRALPLQPVR